MPPILPQFRKPAAGIRIVLLAILLLGVFLRLMLIPYGLPLLLHEDEPIYYDHALRFGLGEWALDYFKKPSFFLYFYAAFYWLAYLFSPFLSWKGYVDAFWQDPTLVAIVGRTVSVVLAMGSIGLLYRLGARVFSPAVGLAAAFFLAVDTTHLRISAIVISDIPSLFCILLSAWLALDVYERGSRRDYFLCAAAIALTVSFKYNVFTGVFLPVAHFFRHGQGKPLKDYPWKLALKDSRLWLSLPLVPVVFLALNPMIFKNFLTFYQHLDVERRHMLYRNTGATREGVQLMASFGKIFGKIAPRAVGWPLYALGLTGLALEIRRRRAAACILFSFPLLFLLVVCQFQLVNAKYLLPVYPFLYLAAAAFLEMLAFRLAGRFCWKDSAAGWIFFALVAGTAFPTMAESLEHVQVFTQPDTRNIAWEALRETARPGDRFFSEPDTVPLDPHHYRSSVTTGDWQGDHFRIVPHAGGQMDTIQIADIRPRYILMELKGKRRNGIYKMQYGQDYYDYVQQHYRWRKLFATHPLSLNEDSLMAIQQTQGFAALTESIKGHEAGKRRYPGPLMLLLERAD